MFFWFGTSGYSTLLSPYFSLQIIKKETLITYYIRSLRFVVFSSSDICTGAHNKFRWLHKNTRGLVWNIELAEKAQAYADELVRINQLSNDVKLPHSQTPEVGENLFWREGENPAKCAHAVLRWFVEF